MKKKCIVLALMFSMVISMLTPVMAFEAKDVSSDYWGAEAIQHLNDVGVMNGFNGYFKPEQFITRAEFVAIINRAFGFQRTDLAKSFKDVDYSKNDWKSAEIRKASSQGYLVGSNGLADVDSNISREEAFVILSRVMKLDKSLDEIGFEDATNISSWAKSGISAMLKAGYITGSNNKISPQNKLTRAEAAKLVDNVMGKLINKSGEVDSKNAVYNNVTINASGVILKNATINGNLYITEGVGTGDVTLDNVVVKGRTLVSGGGVNSIKVNNASLGTLDINVPTNDVVRVEVSGNTVITLTNIFSSAKLEEKNIKSAGFKGVLANLEKNEALDLDGIFDVLNIASDNLNLNINTGKVCEIFSNGNNAQINIMLNAIVEILNLNSSANVLGTGRIITANINSSNVSLSQNPTNIAIKAGIVAVVNGKDVKQENKTIPSTSEDYVVVDTENVFSNKLNPISNKNYSDEKFTAKPLIILMDFPNYKYTELENKETWRINAFAGEDTTPEFYESLFFGDDFYTTADGNKHITVNKFFMEESGGSYELKSDVYGWYTAKKPIEYYGEGDYDQSRSAELVKEAIANLLEKTPDIDLSQYDVEDKWDIDNDGNYDEADGIIDTVVVLHAGLGGEWRYNSLKTDAIWPFRIGFSWYNYSLDLDNPLEAAKLVQPDKDGYYPAYKFEDNDGKTWFAEDFTVFEQDLPLDLFCHEYGHVLGLPDLYSGGTPPVENWSLMGGSYTGNPRGSEPVSYGAICKEFLQNDFEKRGRDYANWQNPNVIDLQDIGDNGLDFVLDQASIKGQNKDAVTIKLPERDGNRIVTPTGNYAYFSDNKDNMENFMVLNGGLDLTSVTTTGAITTSGSAITLSFDAWWDLDPGFDFFAVQVREKGTTDWITLKDTTGYSTDKVDKWVAANETPEQILFRNPGWAITNDSENKWSNVSYDFSQFAGKEIDLRFRIMTDDNTPKEGIYIDNIRIKNDEDILVIDDAEAESKFDFNGFLVEDGKQPPADHYYILEWKNSGADTLVDKGLKTINIGRPTLEYDPGLIVWYINERYNGSKPDQNNYNHKNEQYAGIVDADQNPVWYKYETKPKEGADEVNYQMHDAAFSLRMGTKVLINGGTGDNKFSITDNQIFMNPAFNDSDDYSGIKSEPNEWVGISLVEYGLKVFVTDESYNRSTAKIHIALDNGTNKAVVQNDTIISSIEMNEQLLAITTDKRYGQSAYVELVSEDGRIKQCVLSYINGKYTVNESFLAKDKWKIKHVIFEDKNGNAKAIYNSKVNGIFGIDFDKLIK